MAKILVLGAILLAQAVPPSIGPRDFENLQWRLERKSLNRLDQLSIEQLRAGLSDLPELEFLKLPRHADDSVALALRNLPKLKSLDMGVTEITDKGMEALRRFPTLESLTVPYRATVAGMAPVRALVLLRTLEFDTQQIDDEWIAALGPLRKLEQLSIGGGSETAYVKVTDQGLKPLEEFESLKRLVLRSSDITDKAFVTLGRLKSVKSLGINREERSPTPGGPLTGTGLSHLAKLPLDSLSLEGFEFSKEGLVALSGLTVTKLRIGYSKVPPGTLGLLAALKSTEKLTIDASDPIENEELAKLTALPNLTSLSLSRLKLGPGAARPFQSMKKLKEISFYGNPDIPKAEIEQLAAALGMKASSDSRTLMK